MVDENIGSHAAIPAHAGYYVTKTQHHEAPTNTDPSKVHLPSAYNALITGGRPRPRRQRHHARGRTTTELEAIAANLRATYPKINVSIAKCDVTSEADVLKFLELVKNSHSCRLDVLIHNAGFLDAGWQPITAETAPAANWRRFFHVNVYGVYLVTRHLLPLLLETPKGLKTVIGISSMSSHFASPSIAMGMSKPAMNCFMEFLAASYGAEGLMSYALHPGGVKTRMSTDKDKVPEQLSEMCIDSPDLSAAMASVAEQRTKTVAERQIPGRKLGFVDELPARKDEITNSDMFKFRMGGIRERYASASSDFSGRWAKRSTIQRRLSVQPV